MSGKEAVEAMWQEFLDKTPGLAKSLREDPSRVTGIKSLFLAGLMTGVAQTIKMLTPHLSKELGTMHALLSVVDLSAAIKASVEHEHHSLGEEDVEQAN